MKLTSFLKLLLLVFVAIPLQAEPKQPIAYLADHTSITDLSLRFKDYKPFYLNSRTLSYPVISFQTQTAKEALSLELLNKHQSPVLQEQAIKEDTLIGWIYLFYAEGKDPTSYPATISLIERAQSDLLSYLLPFIQASSRPLPKESFPKLNAPLSTRFDKSFPSITTASAKLALLIMEDLNQTQLYKASEVQRGQGQRRLIYALNYPSDIVTGSDLATKIYIALRANPKFNEELQRVQAEWR